MLSDEQNTVACASTSSSCEQELQVKTSCPKPGTKHILFLSHSGTQKPFVELLCQDLEAADYTAFFDQRPDSLAIAEEFETRIFESARKCQVAVVVLSKEYLNSYWPMKELAAFVRAMGSTNKSMKLLPLFYEASFHDISDESIQNHWRSIWEKLVRLDDGDDVEEWAASVRKLAVLNGVSFDQFKKSEEKYRDAIVKKIFSIAPPALLYDTSKMFGCDRICTMLKDKFVPHTRTSAQVLGLYGMGGLGKTTMSKSLINHFIQVPCFGRVCHIEFKDGMTALQRQQMVMKKLLRLPKLLLEKLSDDDEGWGLLRSGRMKEYPVFLVIDNVQPDEESQKEVRKYLELVYNEESKIMVISRSLDVVKGLLGDPSYCCAIPCLTMEHAAGVFLQQVDPLMDYSSLPKKEKSVVKNCVKEAWFSDRGFRQTNAHGASHGGEFLDRSDGHFHPLSLIALGVYIYRNSRPSDMRSWITHLHKYKSLKGTIQPYDPILSMLGLQFNDLDRVTKLMFLDICLYASKALESPMLSNSPRQDLIDWLANVHEVSIEVVKSKISDLKRSAMINEEGGEIFIHELYEEYVTWYLGQLSRADEFLGVWCVRQHEDRDNFLPYELRRTPPGRCWPELKRIRLENISCSGFPLGKVQEWCNVVVLQLVGSHNLTTINLQGLTCLRHLELKNLKSLQTVTFTEDESNSTSSMPQGAYTEPRHYLLTPLQFVTIDGLPSLERLASFSPFKSLKFLKVVSCRSLTQPPNVQHCSGLERMLLSWHPKQETLPRLNGLTSLRDLTIQNFSGFDSSKGYALKLHGLSSLTSLESLELRSVPVGDLAGLENLTRVEYISLRHVDYLTCLRPLENLARASLRVLDVLHCNRLEGLDELKSLIQQKLEGSPARGENVLHTLSKIRLQHSLSWKSAYGVIRNAHRLIREPPPQS